MPEYTYFSKLVNCNLYQECYQNEDEKHCSHTKCGQGLLHVNSKCFKVITGDFSWTQADEMCRRTHTGHLATLYDPGDWELINLLKPYHSGIIFGIILSSLSRLPNQSLYKQRMYKHIWRWYDGTTAFYINKAVSVQEFNYSLNTMCLMYLEYSQQFLNHWCNNVYPYNEHTNWYTQKNNAKSFVCEVMVTPSNQNNNYKVTNSSYFSLNGRKVKPSN